MKKLIPIVLALLGLGAGMAAGLALKPAPEEKPAAAEGEHGATPEAGAEHASAEGEHSAADSGHAAPEHEAAAGGHGAGDSHEGGYASVALSKPFVVPVFHDQAIAAMVVVSLAVEVEAESAATITADEPKLRDGFLKVMFRHANTGGFDGSFTSGQKLEDLKAALSKTLRALMPDTPTGGVLITEIARQDS